MFHIGDVIVPREGEAPVTSGHYRVLSIGTGTARLAHLSVDREGLAANVTCTLYIPVAILEMFDLILPESDPSYTESGVSSVGGNLTSLK